MAPHQRHAFNKNDFQSIAFVSPSQLTHPETISDTVASGITRRNSIYPKTYESLREAFPLLNVHVWMTGDDRAQRRAAMGTGLFIGMLMILGILVWALAAKMIDDAEEQSRVRSQDPAQRP